MEGVAVAFSFTLVNSLVVLTRETKGDFSTVGTYRSTSLISSGVDETLRMVNGAVAIEYGD